MNDGSKGSKGIEGNSMSNELIKLLGRRGNKKVPSSTAIFNMYSAHNCPSKKLGLCNADSCDVKCYAMKAEYLYPDVLPYRERQSSYWVKVSSGEFVESFLDILSRKRKKFKALRFNESGDFGSQEELDKAEEIATELRKKRIKTYCYSSRSDLDYSKLKNLIVMGSGFIKDGCSGKADIIGKKDPVPEGYFECKGSCKICSKCMQRGSFVALRKH